MSGVIVSGTSVLPERFNVLLNPAHPGIGQVREVSRERLIGPPRLVGNIQSEMMKFSI